MGAKPNRRNMCAAVLWVYVFCWARHAKNVWHTQLTLHETYPHFEALCARCKQCLPGRLKPDVLRAGIVGTRGSIVIRLQPCVM